MLNGSSQPSFPYRPRLAAWWIYKITRAIYWPRSWTHQALPIISLLPGQWGHRVTGRYSGTVMHKAGSVITMLGWVHPQHNGTSSQRVLQRSLCCPVSLCPKHSLHETQSFDEKNGGGLSAASFDSSKQWSFLIQLAGLTPKSWVLSKNIHSSLVLPFILVWIMLFWFFL